MKHVHIIGGGIIGLCSAWYLSKAGVEVTVIDRGNFDEGTSFGNAGMIVPSHFVPMAAPGVISQGMKWLLDNKSPLYVRPRLNLDLMRWLLKFQRSATHEHVQKSIGLLHSFNLHSKQLYKELSDELRCDYEEKGLLMLYRTRRQAEEEEAMAQLAMQHGVQAEILQGGALQSLEPEMQFDVLGGLYFPGDAHLYPDRLMKAMLQALKKAGVHLLSDTAVTSMNVKAGRVESLNSSQGELSVETVIVASGSWSAELLKSAGIHIPLQDGKGYSITVKSPVLRPRIPTILSEAKVAITPMGADVRVGGTLELSGHKPGINQKRVEGIVESVPRYYRNWELPYTSETSVWKGFRPCSPDGLPYVGKTSIPNVSVATGHGMMGLSLGAATGKIMADLLTGEPSILDLKPMSVERFSRKLTSSSA